MTYQQKRKIAKAVITRQLDNAFYWDETEMADGLTDEEKQEVGDEMDKLIRRIEKEFKL